MPLRLQPTCVVCQHQVPKYACASCRARYCSVACYKTHRESCVLGSADRRTPGINAVEPLVPFADAAHPLEPDLDPLPNPSPLRPLTTLKWPYVPDISAYPDPLTRDDPKPLQTHQYEAIATSPRIRALLANPRLCTLLTSIDALRGAERDEALQRALGVDSRHLRNDDAGAVTLDEDTNTLRGFAEAVEEAVRGGREDVLGLDWDPVDPCPGGSDRVRDRPMPPCSR